MMSPLPLISQAYAFVKQDEKARQSYQSVIASNTHFANALVNSSVNAAATNLGANSGFKKPSFNSNGAAKPLVKCAYCNFNGHTKENCYKLIGYPPNWKKKKEIPGRGSTGVHTGNYQSANANAGQFRSLPKNTIAANVTSAVPTISNDQYTQMQQQVNQLSQMMSFFVNNGKSSNSPEDHLASMVTSVVNLVASNSSTYSWLIDTGETDHMCCSLSLLTDVKSLSNPINLSLPTGAIIAVHETGTFSIHPKLVLHNVLFVPSFNYNLLSVSKWISDSGGNVLFLSDL